MKNKENGVKTMFQTVIFDLDGTILNTLEDLAAAWKFIQRSQSAFGLAAEDYIVGGFSAGGHLSAMWGTANLGARSYGLPDPKLLLLGYPLITMEELRGPAAAMTISSA